MPPRTPEKMDEFVLQIAYDLSQQKRTRQYGPEGQKFFDFLDAMTTYGPHALENERKLQQQNAGHDLPKRSKDEKSASRGQLMNTMGDYQSMIFKLEKLGESLHEHKFDSAKNMLPILRSEMLDFYNDYTRFKEAMPEMITNDPVLWQFDQLFADGDCPVGKAFNDKLNGREAELPVEEEPQAKADPPAGPEVLPEYGPMTREQAKKAKEDELKKKAEEGAALLEEYLASEPLQINNQTIENQRNQNQLNTGRKYTARFAQGTTSYEGILGQCQADLGKDGKNPKALLATALAAAKLRKQGEPFSNKTLKKQAELLSQTPGFAAMTKNRRFVADTVDNPEKIDRALALYERENRAAQRKSPAPQSYSEYLRLHSWPNVPEGREKEYLAKLIAARRLQDHKTPFDKELIRKDAAAIQQQVSFNEIVTEGTQAESGKDRTRRWLHEDEVAAADVTLQDKRKERMQQNMVEADRTRKSWAGYRRMHTAENVPENASAEEKRLNLAKAMIAIRGMVDDKPFSVKAARKAAALLVKNPHFRTVTQDPEKVDKVLKSGRVVDLFEEMAVARRKALYEKQEQQQKALGTGESRSLGEDGPEAGSSSTAPSVESENKAPKELGINFNL